MGGLSSRYPLILPVTDKIPRFTACLPCYCLETLAGSLLRS